MRRRFSNRRAEAFVILSTLAMMAASGKAFARAEVGRRAALFKSVDENHKPVDMAAMIKGRPLVVIVGSAS